ncbi:MAG: hypothetical protein KBC84_03575 [Proteobacteria bacterium]|nr:hypothetical protein [Pseudomonadota bacterium]
MREERQKLNQGENFPASVEREKDLKQQTTIQQHQGLDLVSTQIKERIDTLVILASLQGSLLAKQNLGIASTEEQNQIYKYQNLKARGLAEVKTLISNSSVFDIHNLEQRLQLLVDANKKNTLEEAARQIASAQKDSAKINPDSYTEGLATFAVNAAKTLPKAVEAGLAVSAILGKFVIEVVTCPFTWRNPFTSTHEFGAEYLLASQKFCNENIYGGSMLGSSTELANNNSDLGLVFISLNPFAHLANASINPLMEVVDYSYNEYQRNAYNQANNKYLSYSEFVALQEIDDDLKNRKRIFQGCEIAASLALMLATGGASSASLLSRAGLSTLTGRSLGMLKVPLAMAGANATASELMQWDNKNSQGQTEGFNLERFFDSLLAGTAHNLLFVGGLNLGINTTVGARSGVWFPAKEGNLVSKLNSLQPQEAQVVYQNFQRALSQTNSFAKVVDVVDAFSDLGEGLKNFDQLENPSELLANPEKLREYAQRNWKKALGASITTGVALKDATDFSGSEADVEHNFQKNNSPIENRTLSENSLHALRINRPAAEITPINSEIKLAPRRESWDVQLVFGGNSYRGVISGSWKDVTNKSRPDPGQHVYFDNANDVSLAYEEILLLRLREQNKKLPLNDKLPDTTIVEQAKRESAGVVSFYDANQDLIVSTRINNSIGKEFTAQRVAETSYLAHEEIHRVNLPYREHHQKSDELHPGVPGDRGEEIEAFRAQREYIISRNRELQRMNRPSQVSFAINNENQLIIEPSLNPEIANFNDIDRYVKFAYSNLIEGEFSPLNIVAAKSQRKFTKEQISAFFAEHRELIDEATSLLAAGKYDDLIKIVKQSNLKDPQMLFQDEGFFDAFRESIFAVGHDLLLDPALTIEKTLSINQEAKRLCDFFAIDPYQIRELYTFSLAQDLINAGPMTKDQFYVKMRLYIHNQFLIVTAVDDKLGKSLDRIIREVESGKLSFDLNKVYLEDNKNLPHILDCYTILCVGLYSIGYPAEAARIRNKLDGFLSAANIRDVVTTFLHRLSDQFTTELRPDLSRRDANREALRIRTGEIPEAMVRQGVNTEIQKFADQTTRNNMIFYCLAFLYAESGRTHLVRAHITEMAKLKHPSFMMLQRLLTSENGWRFTEEELSLVQTNPMEHALMLTSHLIILGDETKLSQLLSQMYISGRTLKTLYLQLYFSYAKLKFDFRPLQQKILDLGADDISIEVLLTSTSENPTVAHFTEFCRFRLSPAKKAETSTVEIVSAIRMLRPLNIFNDREFPFLSPNLGIATIIKALANGSLNNSNNTSPNITCEVASQQNIEINFHFFLANLSSSTSFAGNSVSAHGLPQLFFMPIADKLFADIAMLRLIDQLQMEIQRIKLSKWQEVDANSQNDVGREFFAQIYIWNLILLYTAKKYKLSLDEARTNEQALLEQNSEMLEFLPARTEWSNASRAFCEKLEFEISEIERVERERLEEKERRKTQKQSARSSIPAPRNVKQQARPAVLPKPAKLKSEPNLSPEQMAARDLQEFQTESAAIKEITVGEQTFPEWQKAFDLFQKFINLRNKRIAEAIFLPFFSKYRISFTGAQLTDETPAEQYTMGLDEIYLLLVKSTSTAEREHFDVDTVAKIWGFLEHIVGFDNQELWNQAAELYANFETTAAFQTLTGIALSNKYKSSPQKKD